MKKLIVLLVGVTFLSGCTVTLPFNNRLSYSAMKDVKEVGSTIENKKISIEWGPNSFPTRIDVQGADGFVGGASRTRIPTGVALSSRIEEAISTFAEITPKGDKLLIKVLEARSGFEYSAGMFNVTPAIDVGTVYLKADFAIDGKNWVNEFRSQIKDSTIGGTSQTGILESAWDDVAVQVAKDVAKHISQK